MTNKFSVSALVNETLTVPIQLSNSNFEIENTVSVYIISSDLRLSDVNHVALTNTPITLDLETGDTQFKIYSNISSYCTNPTEKSSQLSVENLDYDINTKLAIQITALSHTLQNQPIVLNIDNQRYSHFDLQKELSINILPNILQLTGERDVESNVITRHTNISCQYVHGTSPQMYFYIPNVSYIIDSNNAYGIKINSSTGEWIDVYTNVDCQIKNYDEIKDILSIKTISSTHYKIRAKELFNGILNITFNISSTNIKQTLPVCVLKQFDIEDPSTIMRVACGQNVFQNSDGSYVFSIQDKDNGADFIRIQSVFPLSFTFEEME